MRLRRADAVRRSYTSLRRDYIYSNINRASYWDEPRDVGKLEASVLFDAKTGFGSNGAGASRCIIDGPFANLTLRFDEKLQPIHYCITRNLNDCFFRGAGRENDEACLQKDNFVDVWHCLEGKPHGAGHGGVGGIVSVDLFCLSAYSVNLWLDLHWRVHIGLT